MYSQEQTDRPQLSFTTWKLLRSDEHGSDLTNREHVQRINLQVKRVKLKDPSRIVTEEM